MRPWTSPTASPKCCCRSAKRSLGGGEVDGLAFLDQRTDPVDVRAAVHERGRRASTTSSMRVERHGAGVDRLAPGRLLAQRGDIHVAEIGEHQRARDRRRGHAPACRRPRPWRRARAAGARRSGAARRPRRARDRGMRRSSWNSACVPTAMSMSPRASAQRASRAFRAPCRGRSAARRAGRPLRQAARWSRVLAREDLGRRHQRGLPPGLDHVAMAISATTVLPEPTSPCSRRSMRSPAARSARISATACRCDDVSENGKRLRACGEVSRRRVSRGRPVVRIRARTAARAGWRRTRRRRGATSSGASGRVIASGSTGDDRYASASRSREFQGANVRADPFRQLVAACRTAAISGARIAQSQSLGRGR